MAQLDMASSDEETLEGGDVVLEDAVAKHVDGVSQTGATAGNHAAAAALQARLHGEHAAHAPAEASTSVLRAWVACLVLHDLKSKLHGVREDACCRSRMLWYMW